MTLLKLMATIDKGWWKPFLERDPATFSAAVCKTMFEVEAHKLQLLRQSGTRCSILRNWR